MFEIGSSLREARLRQGLDFPELEQATKIRAKYLRALEDEQFDLLPAQTYVKGFLRGYAEYLGLDGQLYVDEFNSRYVVDGDEAPARPRRSPPPRTTPRVQSRVVMLALLGIALVTALVIVAWTRGSANKQAIPGLATTTSTRVGTSAPKRHRASVARLQVTAALGSTSIQVHRGSATGRLLFQGTLEQGSPHVFVARRLWISVARPEVLSARLNGTVVHLPTGGPKTLVVTAHGIRPASGA
jgi:cytoskeleton protein RodZ